MENLVLDLVKSGQPFSVIVAALLLYVLLVKLAKIEAILTKIREKAELSNKILLMIVGDNMPADIKFRAREVREDD